MRSLPQRIVFVVTGPAATVFAKIAALAANEKKPQR